MEEKSYREQYNEFRYPKDYGAWNVEKKLFGDNPKLTERELCFLMCLVEKTTDEMCSNYAKFGVSYTDEYKNGFDEEVAFRKILCLKLNYMR